MKGQYSIEALCALLFAVCVLVALVLLTGCVAAAGGAARSPAAEVMGSDSI